MAYIALYRKWRPANFDEVKGQDTIVRTLRNQIIYNRIGHAYLFCGTRGTGKTSIAKLYAKAVNCQNPIDGNPCNACPSCRAINEQTSLDVYEIDAASNNGVDHIRDIRSQVQYSPTEGKYKVYIIDEVHMLSAGAFNALLKTLEEPPSYVIFILATTEKHRIPVTILSRCQQYDFRRISVDTIEGHLEDLMEKEGIEAEPKALRYIARAADGSMRDALSLLDQCIAFYLGQALTYEKVLDVLGAADTTTFSSLLRSILAADTARVLSAIDQIITEGRDLSQFLSDFLWYLRNLMILKDQGGDEDSLDMSPEAIEALREETSMIDNPTLLRFIRNLSALSGQLRNATQKRILLEVAFIKLCRPDMEADNESISQRMLQLENRLASLSQMAVTGGFAGQAAAGAIAGAGSPVPGQAGEPGQTGTLPAGSSPASSDGSRGGRSPQTSKSLEDRLQERFNPQEVRDLKSLSGQWQKIRSSLPSVLMKNMLKNSRISVTDKSNTILLYFDESRDASAKNAKAYFTGGGGSKLKELSAFVSDYLGREVSFECYLNDPSSAAASDRIDLSSIQEKIHMEITVE